MQEINISEYDNVIKKEKKTCLLYFLSQWCGPCEILTPEIENLRPDFEHIDFYKCDIEKEKQLALRCDVKYVPTIIFYKNGDEITRRAGAIPTTQIKEIIMVSID